ncbi:MAG: hypothetical protein ACR2N7_01880 [Acidimicrobiia bacterium]
MTTVGLPTEVNTDGRRIAISVVGVHDLTAGEVDVLGQALAGEASVATPKWRSSRDTDSTVRSIDVKSWNQASTRAAEKSCTPLFAQPSDRSSS